MTAEPVGWGARGWHRERRRPERSADEHYQGNQKPAVSKARKNGKCVPATHGIDSRGCVVLHVPPGATWRQDASRPSAGSSIILLPAPGRAARSRTLPEGAQEAALANGSCRENSSIPQHLSHHGRGRSSTPCPAWLWFCSSRTRASAAEPYLKHQPEASRVSLLCGGTHVKT